MGCVSSTPRRSISLPDNLVDLNGNGETFDNHVHLISPPSNSPSRQQNQQRTNGHIRSASTSFQRSNPGTYFTVNTVTSRGKSVSGKLEITDGEVILHRNGHSPMKWPLNFLRRYGYEEGIFSFESGRRCQSGPGVFTFRCNRAEDLFNLVQNNIQENASNHFPNSLPPVIWERVSGNGEGGASGRARRTSPNRPLLHRNSDTYLCPKTSIVPEEPSKEEREAVLPDTDNNSSIPDTLPPSLPLIDHNPPLSPVKSEASQSFLLPNIERPEDEREELEEVEIRPRLESKPKSARPASLILSTNTEGSMEPLSASSQLLADNVFRSPSLAEDLQSGEHAYVNVHPASCNNSPASTIRNRKCFSETGSGGNGSGGSIPDPLVSLENYHLAPSQARKTSHTHSYSDVTSDRHPSINYVNFTEGPNLTPRTGGPIEYVTLSVGPSPSQSPMPSSQFHKRSQSFLTSPQRSISTCSSPLAHFGFPPGSLGRKFQAGGGSGMPTSPSSLGGEGSGERERERETASSNYSKIDIPKTLALKQTTRGRSRHDSAF